MIENRLPARLSDYWERIRRDKPLPSIDKLNTQTINDLWQKCLLISVHAEQGQPVYKYDFVGKDLEKIFGAGLAGHKIMEKLEFIPARQMIDQMDKSLKNPFPITVEGQFIDASSKVVKYRSCLLPFGNGREDITNFVIGMSWKSC